MKNRILMVVSAVVAVGCGGGKVGQPWDQNHDGLVEACEGLDRYSCGATSGCHGEAVACLAVCVDDGAGGCSSPCSEDFRCVPERCEELDAAQCSADPRCVLEAAPVCEIACLTGEDCPPCAQPQPVCRTRPPADDCSQRPFETCGVDSRCEVRAVTVCAHEGGGGTPPADPGIAPGEPAPGCGGDCTTTLQCAPRLVENDCAARDADRCEADGACRLVAYACAAVCEDDGNGGCKPCPLPPVSCVPADDVPVAPPPEPVR